MKRKILFGLISIIFMLLLTQVSYAAVEIVPSKDGTGTDSIVNTTISNSYLMCQDMKNTGGSLKGTTVVPHLATNKDWGAVSYLSNSIYGTNTRGENRGIEVTIDGVKYYSTTTNITGVMNWGSNPNTTRFTQTAGIISGYDHSTSTVAANVEEIYKNMDTRFVEIIDNNSTLGMAMHETASLYSGYKCNILTVSSQSNIPISDRTGLFGVAMGYTGDGFNCSGAESNIRTFRPVIWNE